MTGQGTGTDRGTGADRGAVAGRVYLERGQPVTVVIGWRGRGPRNVLIRRADGSLVVRPFRGLRRP
jgi:acetyl esterase